MSFQVVFLASAEQDLKELKTYIIKEFGQKAWQTSYAKIKESVEVLKTFPMSGSLPGELERLGLTQYRQIISGMNRIIYEPRQTVIYIHIVADVRKDMRTLLTKRLLRSG
jgi:plasmid stabilization system protein ParE